MKIIAVLDDRDGLCGDRCSVHIRQAVEQDHGGLEGCEVLRDTDILVAIPSETEVQNFTRAAITRTLSVSAKLYQSRAAGGLLVCLQPPPNDSVVQVTRAGGDTALLDGSL